MTERPTRARFLKSQTWISIPGAARFSLIFGAEDQFHASLPELANVSLLSITRALEEFGQAIGDMYLKIYFYDQGPDFDPDVSPRAPFTLEIGGNGRLSVGAQLGVTDDDYEPYPLLHQVAAPLLRRHRAAPTRTNHYDEHGKVRAYLEFEYSSLRGIRIEDAHRLAGKVSALCSAVAKKGQFGSAVVEALVESGRPETLMGQRERPSFDAKSGPYDLTSPAGQYELAKDVASFANGEAAGLIVCGLRTRKVRGVDTVSEITPLRLEGIRPRDWTGVVRRLVVPCPEGLRVEIKRRAEDPGSGFVLISVPPQPAHLRPFLLAVGRRDDGRIVETDITVPIRIGVDTEFGDAASIHTMLAAGRAALGG